MSLRSPVLLALPLLVLAACATDPSGPQALDGPLNGLEAHLRVESGEVSRGEAFTVRLDVTNTTQDTIVVVTPHSCLYLLGVTRDRQPVEFDGSTLWCFTVFRSHVFLPGETRSYSHELTARMYLTHSGSVGMVAAPAGTYLMEARFEVPPEAGRRLVARTLLRVR